MSTNESNPQHDPRERGPQDAVSGVPQPQPQSQSQPQAVSPDDSQAPVQPVAAPSQPTAQSPWAGQAPSAWPRSQPQSQQGPAQTQPGWYAPGQAAPAYPTQRSPLPSAAGAPAATPAAQGFATAPAPGRPPIPGQAPAFGQAPVPGPMPQAVPVQPQDPRIAWRRRLRRMVNRPVGLSLAYQLVMNAGAIVAMIVLMATVAVNGNGIRLNLGGSSDAVINRWTGVMSLFSVFCAFGLLLLMRYKDILTREFWLGGAHIDHYGEPSLVGRPSRYGGAPMKPLWFLVFVALCLGVQGATILIQMGFSAIGIDLVSPTMDDISASATTVSMWLYIGLVGPICEEVMFRGVLLKELKPLGRDFAILTSALLFGLFHGDVVQGAFAFLLGLVLGFVAMEYSLVWAIALHIFNNAVLSGVIDGLASHYLGDTGYLVYSVALSLIGVIAAIVVFAVYGRGLTQYVRANRSAPGTYLGWTAWTFIVCVVINGGGALVSFITAMLGG